jgi:hypothetical protein
LAWHAIDKCKWIVWRRNGVSGVSGFAIASHARVCERAPFVVWGFSLDLDILMVMGVLWLRIENH